MAKIDFLFAYDAETTPDTRPHQTRDHTRHETTYHMNSTYQVSYSSNTYCCRCSLQQVPRSYSYKEGDAARIEPPPPSPSTCRLCERSSRTLVRPQASGDGTRMPSVLGKSRASGRLPSWARSNSGSQQLLQQYEYMRAASQLVDSS